MATATKDKAKDGGQKPFKPGKGKADDKAKGAKGKGKAPAKGAAKKAAKK